MKQGKIKNSYKKFLKNKVKQFINSGFDILENHSLVGSRIVIEN